MGNKKNFYNGLNDTELRKRAIKMDDILFSYINKAIEYSTNKGKKTEEDRNNLFNKIDTFLNDYFVFIEVLYDKNIEKIKDKNRTRTALMLDELLYKI